VALPQEKSPMKLRTILITLASLALLSTSAGGYFYYSSLKQSAFKQSCSQALSHMEVIMNRINARLDENFKLVKALAGLKQLQLVLEGTAGDELTTAQTVLEHFRDALDLDACYLVDRSGALLASCSRTPGDAVRSENCSAHPYFRQAMQGSPAIYMGLGVTSKKRLVYFSHPVYGARQEEPVGVVVARTSVDGLEREFGHAYEATVVITDPQGLVFMATREDWLYRVLWKDSFEQGLKATASRATAPQPWSWAGLERKGETRAEDLSGNEYLVYQVEVAHYPGWHVVSLSNLQSIARKLSDPLFRATAYIVLTLYVLVGLAVIFLYREASRDIVQRKAVEQALRDSEKQLRFLSAQLMSTQEEERKRIARKMHDSIGLSLDAIKFNLENLQKHLVEGKATPESLNALIALTQQPIEESSKIMTELRPSVLDDCGIVATIDWFCRQFQSIYANIQVSQRIRIEEDDVSEHLKIVIFRVLQEALNNIAQYSKAAQVEISLEKRHGTIAMRIADNGVGFDVKTVFSRESHKRGLGLTSMKERVMLSGGSFSLESVVGKGTSIRAAWFPKAA
jgi:signal transduction histidine kinase